LLFCAKHLFVAALVAGNGLPSRPMSALGGSGRAAPKEEVRV
jgi:hypothetical protein